MGDALKNLSIVALLASVVLLLLALTGGLTISGSAVSLAPWARITAAAVAVLLLAGVVASEVNARRQPSPASVSPLATSSANVFFQTLDQTEERGFPTFVAGAKRVSILCRTAVNLLNHYAHSFEDLARNGCDIRFLLLDPASEASAYVYGGSADFYRHNIAVTQAHLQRLHPLAAARLEIRTTKHAPTMSLVVVEFPEAKRDRLRVQLYFLHSVLGNDRPLFTVEQTDEWYSVFLKEFNTLWESAQPWPSAPVAKQP